MDARTLSAFALCAGLATGLSCSRNVRPSLPNHLAGYLTESPNPGFSLYLQAAVEVEKAAPKLVTRLNWTPGQRAAALKAAQPAINKIDAAHRNGVDFVFSPHSPLAPPGERRGWRFLGRVMVWRLEDALRAKDGRAACSEFIRLLRFSTNLTGGDALDANLGFTMAREGTEVIWPAFPDLSPADLRRLHTEVVRTLTEAPGLQVIIQHERGTMLQAVQAVQDAFLAGDLEMLETALGKQIAPAISYLRRLEGKSAEEQTAYFEGFAREAEEEVRLLLSQAALAPHLWTPIPSPTGERPWKRFAANYFRSGRFLLDWWAEHQARLRLFAVDAALMARLKERKGLPSDLNGLREWLRTDPYSGQPFVYVNLGTDYKLYGFGPDRKDDGGSHESDHVPLR